MELSQVIAYIREIRKTCDGLNKATIHKTCSYKTHQVYGRYVYRYRRTSATVWYIIYNLDSQSNIRIEKIINNYLTIE